MRILTIVALALYAPLFLKASDYLRSHRREASALNLKIPFHKQGR